jgi:hypothetical protein
MKNEELRKIGETAIAKTKQAQKKTEKKETTSPIQVTVSRRYLDVFRYSLTGLLVAVKLGLLTYLPVNPLVAVSWWLVFLPAYILEAAVIAILVALVVTAIVIGLFAVLYIVFRAVILDPILDRRLKKKVAEGVRTGQPTGDAGADILVALRSAVDELHNTPDDEALYVPGSRPGPPDPPGPSAPR